MLRPIIFAASLGLLAQTATAGEAGKITLVVGDVQLAGKPAVLNSAVGEGEMLTTGSDGYVYIKTPDNGLFILRPKSKGRIVTYQIDKQNPANTRVKLELISGVARSQSGDAVKLARQNFRFNTPVAAIGVRGTDFVVLANQETTRVTVLSGGITVSGFAGSCSPDGSGPCEGTAARELSATQRGLLLQVQRGQATPQLMQGGNSLAPDVVAPPRPDEPKPATAQHDVTLDPKKEQQIQLAKDQLNQPKPVVPEPVKPSEPIVTVPPEVTVEPPKVEETPKPVVPPREVTWGRFTSLAGSPATSGLSKAGFSRIATNENYVMFREEKGTAFVTPERGNVSFTLADSDAQVRDDRVKAGNTVATLQNGVLSFDFGKSSFSTSFDLLTGTSETYKMAASGRVYKDGMFTAADGAIPGANMGVTGAIKDLENASYLFRGSLDNHRVVTGATTWKK